MHFKCLDTKIIFAGIDDTIFNTIEEELFANLRKRFALTEDVLFYDTTNFFTYIENSGLIPVSDFFY